MLNDTERAILSRLSEYSEEIETVGHSKSNITTGPCRFLGLVRSSLHKPLTKLEKDGLVFTRIAHVIGGIRKEK